jgi:hypothetical protein
MPAETGTGRTDELDRLLGRLARSAHREVAEWARALLQGESAGDRGQADPPAVAGDPVLARRQVAAGDKPEEEVTISDEPAP